MHRNSLVLQLTLNLGLAGKGVRSQLPGCFAQLTPDPFNSTLNSKFDAPLAQGSAQCLGLFLNRLQLLRLLSI